MKNSPTSPLMEEVISAVLAYFTANEGSINREDIISKNRTAYVARVRSAMMFYLHEYMDLSSVQIGLALQRDHTTVLSGIRSFSDRGDITTLVPLHQYVEARVAKFRQERHAALMSEVAS
jgi:chromosomal replication initiation ATPase DnaA